MAAEEIQTTRTYMLGKTYDSSSYQLESNDTVERDNDPKQITLTVDENGIITAVEETDDHNLSAEDLVKVESEIHDENSYSNLDYESDPDYKPENDVEENFMNDDSSENDLVTEKETANPTIECDICKKKLRTQLNLKSHIVAVHTKKCHSCSTINVEKEPWAEGVRASDERGITCTSCNESLTLLSKVGVTKTTKDGGGMIRLADSMYMCTECDKLFLQKESCIMHQSVHKETKGSICDICGGGFANIISLRQHLKAVHGKLGKGTEEDTDSDEDILYNMYKERNIATKKKKDKAKSQSYECSECNRHYDSRLKFRTHLKTCHRGFQSECNICRKKFIRKTYVQEHMIVKHTVQCLKCLTVNTETEPWPENANLNKTRELFCSKCENILTLNSKPGPRKIKSTREGGMFRKVDGAFACMVCGRMFRKKSSCDKHQPLHMAIKPHNCPYCAKAFTQRELLMKHLKSLHPDKAL